MNKPKIIQIIDVVSNAIAGNRIDEDFIKSCIYGKVDAELYAHLLGKYRGYDGDFFQFYLGTDAEIETSATDLKKSTDALMATGTKSLFKTTETKGEDGKVTKTYDTDKIYKVTT